MLSYRTKEQQTNLVTAIGVSVAHTALNLNSKAIVASTESGHTARMISKYRPKSDIIAVTPNDFVARQLQLVWGVTPIIKDGKRDTDGVLNTSVSVTIDKGYADTGDLLIITAGVPTGEAGTTNLMKLHIVGDVLIRAQGIGRKSAVGQVMIVNSVEDLQDQPIANKVIVVQSVTQDMTPFLKDAAALVTVEGGLTSTGAIVGLNLELPTIVGATDALTILKQDMTVTVDAEQNNVFNGHAKVL